MLYLCSAIHMMKHVAKYTKQPQQCTIIMAIKHGITGNLHHLMAHDMYSRWVSIRMESSWLRDRHSLLFDIYSLILCGRNDLVNPPLRYTVLSTMTCRRIRSSSGIIPSIFVTRKAPHRTTAMYRYITWCRHCGLVLLSSTWTELLL